jgi:diguanylate cyclase (GGDEF)-like protein/PAS domain S-box-containing protein
MMISDSNNQILRVNSAFTSITGYSAKDVIGKKPRILSSDRHDAHFYTTMWESINRAGTWEGEIWNRRKNGEVYPEYLNITAVRDADNRVLNYVATFNDITKSKIAENEIYNLAFYDPLTLLPNRRLFTDRLGQALTSRTRNNRVGAILFIDMDNFKALNDAFGHGMGDSLLQQVAKRLIATLRECDTVARLGGDEFVVMMEDLSTSQLDAAEQTEAIGEEILMRLHQPYQLGEKTYITTASIGATLFNDAQREVDELMKQADIAMYQSKKAGRNTLRFFDPEMQEIITSRATMEIELRKALVNRELQLYFQIQVDSSQHTSGAEVLLRWLHPEKGIILPAQFISLAEDTGLIIPIGKWVLETACIQLKAWQQDPLTRELVLAVNVSAKQFRQADFANQVQATIAHQGIDPKLLKLELTESMLIDSIDDTIAKMNILNAIGVQFSLDDFGTGYSSLQYLKSLPLDQIKIDQSFVRDITLGSSDKAIVRTIIAMAESLKLDIIAEGVETEAQRQLLLEKGCLHFQGYLFSEPLPIKQFEMMLKNNA